MSILLIVLFWISFKGFSSHSITACQKVIFDQEATFTLEEMKEALDAKGFVLIPGKVMKKLLMQHGASEEDLAVLESGYIHKTLPVDQLPAMQHRQVFRCFIIQEDTKVSPSQIACRRVLLNMTDNTIFPANTHAVTQLPHTEIASEEGDGARIAYRR